MAAQPVYATAIGDRRFDHRLRDNSPAASAADAARLARFLEAATAIEPGTLDPADAVTRAALIDFLRSELDLVAAGIEAWAVDPLDGPQVAYLNIPSFQPVRTNDDGDALVARWQAMGPWLDRLVDSTRDAARRGTAAPQANIRN